MLREDPKEILRAARDADKITHFVLDLEKDRAPSSVEKLPRLERPSTREVAQEALAEARRTLGERSASGRER